ncbi:hypothetical protein BU26DRAFT_520942 [Trematosphaeria pertusa]|uniref:Uncharacterized protein n=1 Tax=Trematosphaeria pertusa TaxID=390896 RepID=A0A6A6I7X6_9PLEO|nr:uncharacterized protein BU26DRAFT_520942 [Trematosphaeria pertusa]KAF2246471.1 hypothetical protein BU26DRAFT_520942 [Trematosphaeria pertusa]
MANSSSGDCVQRQGTDFQCMPLELTTMIVEQLEEFDLASQSHSSFIEMPTDRLVLARHWPAREDVMWVTFTNASRSNIYNARSASRRLYAASFKSFAKLLGDRRFRLTKPNMGDLKDISRAGFLRPYVQTLTFGTATFLPPDHKILHDCLQGLKQRDRDRLVASYNKCATWQQTHMPDLPASLAAVLGVFPQLDTIRIAVFDFPAELAGWLGPGDQDIVHADFSSLHRNEYRGDTSRLYRSGTPKVLPCIYKALGLTNLNLKSISISDSTYLYVNPRPIMQFSALRTLRISMLRQYILPSGGVPSPIIQILATMSELEDLVLITPGGGSDYMESVNLGVPIRSSMLKKISRVSEEVFNSLRYHRKLRRIELSEAWAFTEADLTTFITTHSDALQCLILRYPLLTAGSWHSVLSNIAGTTDNKLEFLSIRWPFEQDVADGRLLSVDIPPEKLSARTYPVNFQSLSIHGGTAK